MTGLAVLVGICAGMTAGAVSAVAWLRRDEAGQHAWSTVLHVRRGDRAREAVVLARENLYGHDVDRALKWARRAVRLDRRDPEAHAVLGACRQAVAHYGQAIRHHRRAEDIATDVARGDEGSWRLQNAVDAVRACMYLRTEATDEEAQVLWDETRAWARLAYRLNSDEAGEEFALSPWLASFTSKEGEPWLQP